MGTSHKLPKPVSRKQLDNQVTNNCNSTGNVTSRFYIGFASTGQQKYRRKMSQSARCLRPVNTYISSSAVRVARSVSHNVTTNRSRSAKTLVGTGQINPPALSGSAEQHTPSSEPQCRATRPTVSIAAPSANFDHKSPSHRNAVSRLRPQVARPSQRRQPTSTTSRPAIATPSPDFNHKSPGHRNAVSWLRPQVARPSQRRQPTSTTSRPAIATPSADLNHKSPGHRNAVSWLQPQVARTSQRRQLTSTTSRPAITTPSADFDYKSPTASATNCQPVTSRSSTSELHITQFVYLQSVQIKVHTICNCVLIVAWAPHVHNFRGFYHLHLQHRIRWI
jgi:hypothetical protein